MVGDKKNLESLGDITVGDVVINGSNCYKGYYCLLEIVEEEQAC